MTSNNIDVLPLTEIFTDLIATRDFSRFDINDTDTEEEKVEKRAGLLGVEQIMDMYTEKLIPAVAGPTLFHPKIRHFEEMTTSKMPPIAGLSQLRIPATTEAMAIMAYANNRTKWQSMIDWKRDHPGTKLPKYSTKNPTVNREFKELYSNCGGKQHPWGGWSTEGRKIFNKLQKKIYESREKNLDRHIKADRECVARLHEKYKDMHSETEPPNKKQKHEIEIGLDDDEELDFIVEL